MDGESRERCREKRFIRWASSATHEGPAFVSFATEDMACRCYLPYYILRPGLVSHKRLKLADNEVICTRIVAGRPAGGCRWPASEREQQR